MRPLLFKNLLFLLIFSLLSGYQGVFGQATITLRGTVFNMTRTKPLQSVSVTSSSGRGTVTDSNGRYVILVSDADSISFSYLGRETFKYPVKTINAANDFDIALHVEPTELRTVHVAPRNYHMDSLQNRKDYAKYFDYKKPGIKISSNTSDVGGVGLDLDEVINMFRFNRNRRLASFQHRLIEEEQEKFVDHRFTPSLVKKITHLNSPELDSFMVKYRPSFKFTKSSSDYDFEDYIKLAAKEYKKNKNLPKGEMKKENNPK